MRVRIDIEIGNARHSVELTGRDPYSVSDYGLVSHGDDPSTLLDSAIDDIRRAARLRATTPTPPTTAPREDLR